MDIDDAMMVRPHNNFRNIIPGTMFKLIPEIGKGTNKHSRRCLGASITIV